MTLESAQQDLTRLGARAAAARERLEIAIKDAIDAELEELSAWQIVLRHKNDKKNEMYVFEKIKKLMWRRQRVYEIAKGVVNPSFLSRFFGP